MTESPKPPYTIHAGRYRVRWGMSSYDLTPEQYAAWDGQTHPLDHAVRGDWLSDQAVRSLTAAPAEPVKKFSDVMAAAGDTIAEKWVNTPYPSAITEAAGAIAEQHRRKVETALAQQWAQLERAGAKVEDYAIETGPLEWEWEDHQRVRVTQQLRIRRADEIEGQSLPPAIVDEAQYYERTGRLFPPGVTSEAELAGADEPPTCPTGEPCKEVINGASVCDRGTVIQCRRRRPAEVKPCNDGWIWDDKWCGDPDHCDPKNLCGYCNPDGDPDHECGPACHQRLLDAIADAATVGRNEVRWTIGAPDEAGSESGEEASESGAEDGDGAKAGEGGWRVDKRWAGEVPQDVAKDLHGGGRDGQE